MNFGFFRSDMKKENFVLGERCVFKLCIFLKKDNLYKDFKKMIIFKEYIDDVYVRVVFMRFRV